ncbi:MAG: STAS domain-containing protein [Candidatus Riflebacteria bacterium]|nr:STAS domain-containing protein [Candidatus Riflebacteria bacterium]
MQTSYSITKEEKDDVILFRLNGYIAEQGGDALKTQVEEAINEGYSLFGLDFTGVSLVSSPGIAHLINICSIVMDDLDGEIYTWGLDKHHTSVFEMTGLFSYFVNTANEEEALEHLRG